MWQSRISLHVLHIIDSLAVGGSERMLVEIANRTARDHRVSVCVTRSQTSLASRLDLAIELLVLGRRRRFEIRPLMRLARWCRANAVDVIHCHARSTFGLVALLRATHAIAAPLVFHDHGGFLADPSVPAWLRVAGRYMDAYVGISDEQIAWAQGAGFARDRIYQIANAIDMSAFGTQTFNEGTLPPAVGARLICVGGLRNEKAVDVLLDAIATLRHPATLFIVGGDIDAEYARRVRARAARSDLIDRVKFLGEREDAMALAREADIAVHSARSESGPLVLAEYAAIGVPFVSTLVGGLAVSFSRAGIGRFVPPEQVDVLAGAIDDLLGLPEEERRRLGSSWRSIACRHFDISEVMPQWYRVYSEVMG